MGRTRYQRSLAKVIHRYTWNVSYGAEVGVWKGKTSRFLLEEFPDLFLFCVDLWELGDGGKTVSLNQKELVNAHHRSIKCLKKFGGRVCVIQDSSMNASTMIKPGLLDFVFLDASHDDLSVAQDLVSWIDAVRVGGLVFIHDYNGKWHHQSTVKRAVDRFCLDFHFDLKVIERADTAWFRVEN